MTLQRVWRPHRLSAAHQALLGSTKGLTELGRTISSKIALRLYSPEAFRRAQAPHIVGADGVREAKREMKHLPPTRGLHGPARPFCSRLGVTLRSRPSFHCLLSGDPSIGDAFGRFRNRAITLIYGPRRRLGAHLRRRGHRAPRAFGGTRRRRRACVTRIRSSMDRVLKRLRVTQSRQQRTPPKVGAFFVTT